MFIMEDQKNDELVQKVVDGIAGMRTSASLVFLKSDYVKFGIAAGIGSAVGTGVYLGVRHVIHVTKRKLRERKLEQ
jgi:hypothetical protein